MVIYLDDGIVAVGGEQAVMTASHAVQSDLAGFGIVMNVNKSRLEPTH